MERVNKIDRLFALEALRKKVVAEMDELKSQCSWELEQAFEEEGTTQRRSPYFGKEAGSFSIVFASAQPEHEEVEYRLSDMTKFAGWCNENRLDVDAYVMANAPDFSEWLAGKTGEIPEGIDRQATLVEAVAERPKGTRLSVKDDVVFQRLGSENIFEAVNQLLLGDGND